MATERPRRLSREERRSQTREWLLGAAAAVFNRLGYHGASLEEVAAEAGFTKGAVYSNFATKADLFLALADRISEGRSAAILDAYAQLPLPAFLAGIGPYLRSQAATEEATDLLSIEFWLAAMRDPRLRRQMAENLARFRTETGSLLTAKLAAERAESEFTGEELATIFKALGDGILLQLYLDPAAVDPALLGRAFRRIVGLPEPDGDATGAGRATDARWPAEKTADTPLA